jgi:general secretion pathway protein N
MLGIVAYLLMAFASFPARIAYRWAPTDNAVVLAGLEGTIWSGRATAGSAAGLVLTDVEWNLSPWALLLGRLRGRAGARLTEGFVETDFAVTPASLRLDNLRASASLEVLAQSDLLALLGAIGGQASLVLDRLVWRDERVADLGGELRLRELAVPPLLQASGSPLIPLGSYRVELGAADPKGLVARFADEGGPLEVIGTASLDNSLQYRLDARVRPRPDAAPEVVQGLQLVGGSPDASGYQQMTLSGSL